MRSHDIDYEIRGDDLQFVEVYLDPEETAVAEAGTMIFMDEGVTFEAKMGDGSEPEGGGGFFRKAKSAAGPVPLTSATSGAFSSIHASARAFSSSRSFE